MIEQAKAGHTGIKWVLKDASEDLSALGKFDIVFSNAAIQWIADQKALLDNMFSILKPGGILAVQVPCTKNMPIQTELNRLVSSQKWCVHFFALKSMHYSHTAGYYYNILSALTGEIELWETDYHHIMDSHADLVQWYKSTGLRPYLDCLRSEALIQEFMKDFHFAISRSYAPQSDGKVLFPFTRIFFTAKNE
jgi:trans-aconitate 2-methyltransferase